VSPINLPLPFVWSFPFVLLVLGLCFVKYALQRALAPRSVPEFRPAVTGLILVFFAWVAVRYLMDPVLPGVAVGRGNDVTGFRAYLGFFTCVVLLGTIGLYIGSVGQALSFVRSLIWVSLVFSVLFLPLTLTRSLAIMDALIRQGCSWRCMTMAGCGSWSWVCRAIHGGGAMLPAVHDPAEVFR
jgi:hypothetical protein